MASGLGKSPECEGPARLPPFRRCLMCRPHRSTEATSCRDLCLNNRQDSTDLRISVESVSTRRRARADVRVRCYFGRVPGRCAAARIPSGHVGCVHRTARRKPRSGTRQSDAEPTADQELLLGLIARRPRRRQARRQQRSMRFCRAARDAHNPRAFGGFDYSTMSRFLK